NLAYGRPGASPAQIRAAAEAVDAHAFIEALPQSYDTRLAEQASTLSQGQRQLLSFARAVLADPRILILDEATSSIDTRTEQRIQVALGRLLRGRTSIVIAHRLSTIQNADLIVVIESGQLVERGSHAVLLSGTTFASIDAPALGWLSPVVLAMVLLGWRDFSVRPNLDVGELAHLSDQVLRHRCLEGAAADQQGHVSGVPRKANDCLAR